MGPMKPRASRWRITWIASPNAAACWPAATAGIATASPATVVRLVPIPAALRYPWSWAATMGSEPGSGTTAIWTVGTAAGEGEGGEGGDPAGVVGPGAGEPKIGVGWAAAGVGVGGGGVGVRVAVALAVAVVVPAGVEVRVGSSVGATASAVAVAVGAG